MEIVLYLFVFLYLQEYEYTKLTVTVTEIVCLLMVEFITALIFITSTYYKDNERRGEL